MNERHHLTPITCHKCGKPATFEFLYQNERMCAMCYMVAKEGTPPAEVFPLTEEERSALAELLGEDTA